MTMLKDYSWFYGVGRDCENALTPVLPNKGDTLFQDEGQKARPAAEPSISDDRLLHKDNE